MSGFWVRSVGKHPRTVLNWYIGPVQIFFNRRVLRIYRGFTVLYSEKGGRPVLKGETSWTKINGFMLNSPWGHLIFVFRRPAPSMR